MCGNISKCNDFPQPASSPASRPGSGAPHQKLHVAARRRTRFLISEASAPPGGGGSEARPVDAVLVCFRLDSSVSLAGVVSSWSSLPATATTVLVGTMSDIRYPVVTETFCRCRVCQ